MILGETNVNLELGKHDIVDGLALAPSVNANAKSNSRCRRMSCPCWIRRRGKGEPLEERMGPKGCVGA